MEPQHPSYQASNFSISDFVEIIVKRWRMIISITAAATVAAAICSLLLTDVYTATAKILPPQQSSGLLSSVMMQGTLASIGGEMIGESKTARLYSEMLRIESLRDPIIDRFKLKDVYKKKTRHGVYLALTKKVAIQTGKEGIITIRVEDTDPKRAADMANTFIDELKKLSAKLNMTGAGDSKHFFEERISVSKQQLIDAENKLKAFQSKYKALDAQQQANATLSALAQLNSQLMSQEIQLDILLRTYSETSQEVMNQRQGIEALKTQIARYETSGRSVVPGFENAPERGQQYLHLMRTFKTAESIYDMLIKQYENACLNEANDVSTIQVLQRATVPEVKSKPDRVKFVILAVIIAGFASCILAFFLEHSPRWKRIPNKGVM